MASGRLIVGDIGGALFRRALVCSAVAASTSSGAACVGTWASFGSVGKYAELSQ